MATVNVYDVVIPTFTNGLKTFDHILTKAEEYAKEKGLDANATFPQARLIEDQKPLIFQVQNATKTVLVTIGRLTGTELPPFESNEQTLEDLHKRIQDTIQILRSVDAATVNAKANDQVTIPFGGKQLPFSGKNAALSQGVPNFIFHLTTGYSILRAKGVPVGKSDFIGSFLGV